MKKIILIVIASLMFANIGYAETTLIEDTVVKRKNAIDFRVATICVDGYKFVVTMGGDGRSIVQFMRQNIASKAAYPVKCIL